MRSGLDWRAIPARISEDCTINIVDSYGQPTILPASWGWLVLNLYVFMLKETKTDINCIMHAIYFISTKQNNQKIKMN